MVRAAVFAFSFALAACAALPQPATAPATPQSELRGELFLVTYRPGPAWRVGEPMNRQALGPHAAYWRDLVANGGAFAAGGFVESEGGMAMIVAADRAGADAVVAADPAVVSGVFVGQIEHWRPGYRTEAPLPRP